MYLLIPWLFQVFFTYFQLLTSPVWYSLYRHGNNKKLTRWVDENSVIFAILEVFSLQIRLGILTSRVDICILYPQSLLAYLPFFIMLFKQSKSQFYISLTCLFQWFNNTVKANHADWFEVKFNLFLQQQAYWGLIIMHHIDFPK